MSKFTQLFRSRTFWTLVGLILIAEIPVIQQILPPLDFHALELAFGVIAIYFHLNPSQVYTPAGITPPVPGQAVTVQQP